MHIANYCGPLTFIEVTICGFTSHNANLEIILEIRCFYTKTRTHFIKLAHLVLVYTVF